MTSTIKVDTISENTSANGVAIDGVTLKDGGGTFTSPVLVPDGSTSAVSLGNDGDPNTGIYFQAADSLGLVLGGSRKLSATSAGIAIENGTLSAKGGAVFNEDSADVDFRVESNGNTHMLFVDGGNDKVGISTSSPGRTLSIGNDGIIGLEGSQNAIAFTDSSTLRAYVTSGAFGDHNGDGLGIVTATGEPIKFFTNGGERMRIDSTGAVTKPSQPAFLAIISGTQSNIANGNTIAFGTEVYDQNADFASNTFTAPVTGKYQFNFLISVTELDFDATFHRVQLVTSNRTFNFDIKSSQHYTADPNYATFDGSMCVDMDANDTAVLQWSQSAGNSSSDVFDSTYFSGHLAC